MDIKQVGEAVAHFKHMGLPVERLEADKKYLKVLIDLAETVLSVGAKMPEKKHREHNQHLTSGDWWACNYCGAMDNCGCCDVYNEAIDQCTLAFAGMIPEEKRLVNKMPYIGYNDEITGWNACRDAILSAMKGGSNC